MSLRTVRRLATRGITANVLDLRWLAPLPVEDLLTTCQATGRVVVVDETRHAGGVGEGVITALVEGGFAVRSRGSPARTASSRSDEPPNTS